MSSIGILFTSNALVSIFGLLSLGLTTQTLGAAGLGLLALVEAYGRAFEQLIRIEPSQALIRYSSEAGDRDGSDRFGRLVKFSILMDVVGSVLAAAAALAGLLLVRDWFGIDQQQVLYFAAFALTILVPAPNSAIALLRLFSRFKLYAQKQVGLALLRLILTAALWAYGAGLGSFVAMVVLLSVIDRLVPSVLVWRTLQARLPRPLRRQSVRGVRSENPGIWRYMLTCNANVLVRNSTRQFDVVLLGGMIGAADLGFYVVAKRIGMVAIRVARPVQFVVFPKLCDLAGAGEYERISTLVRRFVTLFSCLGVVVLLVFLVVGPRLVELVFGREFLAVTPMIALHILAASLFMTGAILNSAMQSLDRTGTLLAVTIVASAVFFVGIIALVPIVGVYGASVMYLGFNAIWLGGCWIWFGRALRAAAVRPIMRGG